jgi:hypothetical protein
VRLAVAPEQVETLSLPDDPTHPGWVQAEAIPPATMTAILREAITSLLDEDVFAALLAKEEELRSRLLITLNGSRDEEAER